MIVGEVKEGRAVLNAGGDRSGRPPGRPGEVWLLSGRKAPALVQGLTRQWATTLPDGHRLRLVAFGAVVEPNPGGSYQRISLGHIIRFLQSLREHWDVLRYEDSKDPALGLLTLLEKCIGERS